MGPGRASRAAKEKQGDRETTLDSLFRSLPSRPEIRATAARFVPPPRFREKTFDQFQPLDASHVQAVAALRAAAGSLRRGTLSRFLSRVGRSGNDQRGIYLDGGFGVGKTHLLAALWNAAPDPRAYLSFDELMYFVGMFGVDAAAEALEDRRLIAVDEWELDDPGNLKMAIAFLRRVLRPGTLVAVTSNTVPLELGAGRFSQKDFRAELDELASGFAVLELQGGDFRRRHFESRPDLSLYLDDDQADVWLQRHTGAADVGFDHLLEMLATVHPIRFREIATGMMGLMVRGLRPIHNLAEAVRWVHFIDALYDAEQPFAATGDVMLGDLFSEADREGAYGKKLSRCLSRMEEMLGEAVRS